MPEGIQLKNISGNNLEQCLKCSICTAYCPVSAVEPAYPGPKHSGPDLERDDLNSMIGSVADTAADLGRQVMDELRTQHDKHTDNKE